MKLKPQLTQDELNKMIRKQWDFNPVSRIHGVKGKMNKFSKKDRHTWKKDI